MPLTEPVEFKARLEKGNRIQLPKLVRWKYKLEQDQVLKVTLTLDGSLFSLESFHAKMHKSGRITVPKLTLALLHSRITELSLIGAAMRVRLEPV